ncbi:iron uptake system protein EfeO [Aureimonas psammosilenae]|uniref:iron uptake system protein EfeO n=1 Tax=Aureimonas psammosilenae TaxID=2495496 RepID=UPI001260936A|nr:iron uptake system protein EfeO [Aureimonas psammosilenae]
MSDLSPKPTAAGPNKRVMVWALAGAACLMLAGGAAFAFASMRAGAAKDDGGNAVTVTLRDGRCEPNALSVPAGRAQFRIVNATTRAVEWEILDGVMVVEERENIAPGLSQTLGAKLRPGGYAITCGLLSNPRGTLTVTPGTETGGARPELVAFIGPLAEYRVYLSLQANEFAKAASALDAAMEAGDMGKSRELLAAARAPYLRIAPVAGRFADLDSAIDPVATYLEKREADPAFTGFHRIEYGLFAKNSLDGLAPVSAKLVEDAGALKERLRALRLAPNDMGDGAVRQLEALAETRIPAGENLYAHTDLPDIEAEVAGIAKIVALLKPVTKENAPEKTKEAEEKLAALGAAVKALEGPNGYPGFDTVDAAARTDLSQKAKAAAEALAALNLAVGMDADGA